MNVETHTDLHSVPPRVKNIRKKLDDGCRDLHRPVHCQECVEMIHSKEARSWMSMSTSLNKHLQISISQNRDSTSRVRINLKWKTKTTSRSDSRKCSVSALLHLAFYLYLPSLALWKELIATVTRVRTDIHRTINAH